MEEGMKRLFAFSFPDAQIYLFRRFCRWIRLPNAHCVKKSRSGGDVVVMCWTQILGLQVL